MFSDYNHFKKHNIPGPRPEFFFGNTKKSILKKRNIAYDVDDIYKKFKGKTPFAGFFHGKTPYILALDPEVVKICRKFRNNNFAVSCALKSSYIYLEIIFPS